MDIFCWNIRGFNDKTKRCGFRKCLRLNKPIFGGLLETHVCPSKAASLIAEFSPGGITSVIMSFQI